MFGNVREPGAPVWYICWPKANNRGRDDKLADHPKTVRIREDVLEAAITDFYAERVFGRSRIALLTAELASYDDRATQERAAERSRLVDAVRAPAGIGPAAYRLGANTDWARPGWVNGWSVMGGGRGG